ncbi:MAG: efflux RND transporter periplasmic adaptor subunit [Pirellulales bacterium]
MALRRVPRPSPPTAPFRCCCYAAITLAVTACGRAPEPAPQPRVEPVYVAEVIERPLDSLQTLVGSAMPIRSSLVGSPVDGRVARYWINEGDFVAAGDKLAELRQETLEIELAGAEHEIDLRKLELEELVNGSRKEEIEEARATMDGAEALMHYTERKLLRSQRLYQQSRAVSEDELEDTRSQAIQARQAYLAAKASLALARKGPRAEKIEQARARVEAQKKVRDALGDRLALHTIRAPFDGHVVSEHTEEGEWVRQGDPIARIVQINQIDVKVFVSEDDMAALHVDAPAEVTFDALPDRRFEGRVALIVPQADLRSRSFPVKIRLENPAGDENHPVDHLIKAGMLASVTLAVGRSENALLVPKDALVLGGLQPTVFTFQPDPNDSRAGLVRPQAVSLKSGYAIGGLIQVFGPLRGGQQVVVQGNERLIDGQRVRVVKVVQASEPPSPVAADRPAVDDRAPPPERRSRPSADPKTTRATSDDRQTPRWPPHIVTPERRLERAPRCPGRAWRLMPELRTACSSLQLESYFVRCAHGARIFANPFWLRSCAAASDCVQGTRTPTRLSALDSPLYA